jgi:hypothetical protein
MAEMDPIPVEVRATCRRCGETVYVKGRVQMVHLDSIPDMDNNRVRMVYKVETKLDTEVHVCLGEWDEVPQPKLLSADEVRVQLGFAARKKVLVVAPSLGSAEGFLERNAEWFKEWDVTVHRSDLVPDRLRGKQFHVAILLGDAPEDLQQEVYLATRLGKKPVVSSHGVYDTVSPDALIAEAEDGF